MLNTAELKALLRSTGLRLTKRWGQHHLIDPGVIDRVIDACQLTVGDTVVEIGPGLGALTEPLCRRAGKVIAVEVDRAIASLLSQRLSRYPNLAVVTQDILAFDWQAVAPVEPPAGPGGVVNPRTMGGDIPHTGMGGLSCGVIAVGAIPYHITSPILVSLSEHRQHIRRAILIVQQEVARRVAAHPGTKAYGRLSVLAQYGWEVEPLLTIARRAFFPQPQVESCGLRLVARSQPAAAVKDEPLFFNVVKAAFSQRRKTLANCLASQPALGIGRSQVEAWLATQGLPATVRGEALSLKQFAHLADAVHGIRQSGKALR